MSDREVEIKVEVFDLIREAEELTARHQQVQQQITALYQELQALETDEEQPGTQHSPEPS